MKNYNLITILGATASGKTGVATNLAYDLNSEIISADSRQVYRGMDLGTGKDIEEYTLKGKSIPYHLIDIMDAGTEYNVYRFQQDFIKAFETVTAKGILPVLCGGSGMYIDAVLKGYQLIQVPKNEQLREELKDYSLEDLTEKLKQLKNLHNKSDIETKRRALRAIEIETYYLEHPKTEETYPEINSLNIGIFFDRELRRKRISERLQQRIDEGMIDEVRNLIAQGVSPESLIYYGLEYKFLTMHVIGELSFDEMYRQLEIAIHQFSKRQMTWYRNMERNGTKINWIDGTLSMEEKVSSIKHLLHSAD